MAAAGVFFAADGAGDIVVTHKSEAVLAAGIFQPGFDLVGDVNREELPGVVGRDLEAINQVQTGNRDAAVGGGANGQEAGRAGVLRDFVGVGITARGVLIDRE